MHTESPSPNLIHYFEVERNSSTAIHDNRSSYHNKQLRTTTCNAVRNHSIASPKMMPGICRIEKTLQDLRGAT